MRSFFPPPLKLEHGLKLQVLCFFLHKLLTKWNSKRRWQVQGWWATKESPTSFLQQQGGAARAAIHFFWWNIEKCCLKSPRQRNVTKEYTTLQLIKQEPCIWGSHQYWCKSNDENLSQNFIVKDLIYPLTAAQTILYFKWTFPPEASLLFLSLRCQ